MILIAITEPYFYPGEGADIVRALTEGGFRRVHIRKPGASEEQVGRLLDDIDSSLYGRLSLHDCFGLAVSRGIGGVHLNSRNPQAPAGWTGLVSRSIHSVGEIAGVSEDYAFISPVFDSFSKPGYRGRIDLKAVAPLLNDRIYALGGVSPDRLPELASAGFVGAAMLGAAWRATVDRKAFRLQFISHPGADGSVTDGVRRVLEGGCRWVQLRHKDADSDTLRAEGAVCRDLCTRYGATFIIDDHVELVNELRADGVHLGKNDMPVAEARRLLGPSVIIGATANTFDDIARAVADGADYIGLGPFRFTSTKANLSPVLGLEGYADILGRCRAEGITVPVVAIGGINDADIPSILATGAAGIAISSSILRAQSAAAKTRALPVSNTQLTLTTT